MNKILDHYRNGRYLEATKISSRNMEDDFLKIQACIKGNRVSEAVYRSMKWINLMFSSKLESEFVKIFAALQNNNVLMTAYRVMSETEDVKVPDKMMFRLRHIIKECKGKETLIFPIVWPVAFGDMIVVNQFIRYLKYKYNKQKVIVIIPLNRKDLKELFILNKDVNHVLDITTMPEEEKERGKSLLLQHPDGKLNISVQENICRRMVKILQEEIPCTVYKLRYFPLLDGFDCIDGFRIWEERARLWIEEKIELPKFMANFEAPEKIITVHFRNADYSDEARNVPDAYAQEIINAIKLEYPEYTIVRIRDSKMTELNNCNNLLTDIHTVYTQVKYIQRSKLFIGCHSAPQMLALACMKAPVICINYTVQETTNEMGDNIPCLSYAPLGQQVRKIFYTKMYDENGKYLVPRQNSTRARYEFVPVADIMEEVRKVLG